MNTKDIIMLLYGYFPSDPRVRKEVMTLIEDENNHIRIVCLKADDTTENFPRTKTISLIQKNNPIKRQSIFGLLSFWLLTTIFLLRQKSGYIIHSHDLTTLPPIILPSLLKKAKFVIYDSHEFFPEAAHCELGSFFGIFFLILEKICMKFVDFIIGISPPQKKLMTHRYRKPFLLIPNYPSKKIVTKLYLQEKIEFPKNRINIISHGVIRRSREYFTLIDTMKLLKDNKDIHLILIGDGPDFDDLVVYTNEMDLKSVTFTGRLPFTEAFRYLRSGDIAIGMHDLSFNSSMGCSNKLYECLAAGIPIIYSDLIASRLIMKEAFVKTINPSNASEIRNAILELITDEAIRKKASKVGFELFQRKYNWEKIIPPLKLLYKEIDSK